MEKVAVMKRVCSDGREILAGIYSSRGKAEIAASGLMANIDKMTVNPGKWLKDERKHEIQYSREDGERVEIDFWQVNGASVNGEWVVV